MKIICINNKLNLLRSGMDGEVDGLTKGKVYDAIEYSSFFKLINDIDEKETFVKERFIKLREYNLKKLGI